MALEDISLYDPTEWYAPTAQIINKGTRRGRVFTDAKGYKWQLLKLHTALAGASTVAGRCMYYMDPENYSVTDDQSIAFTIGGVNIFAGLCVADGITVSGATTSTDKWMLLLIDGPYDTVLTDGGDDIVEGGQLVLHATTDGAVDLLTMAGAITDPADTPANVDALRDDLVANTIPSIETLFLKLQYTQVGFAIDDDVDADNTVKAWIKKRAFC